MKNSLIVIFLALFTVSCVSTASFQTAKTTDKGDFGAGLASSLAIDESADFVIPAITAHVRYGITEKIDAGIRFGVLALPTLDVKYQFYESENGKIAAAVGGFGGFATFNTANGEQSNRIGELGVPIFASLHLTEWLAFYINPRISYRGIHTNDAGNIENQNELWYGLNTGIRLGKKVGFLVEYAAFGILPGTAHYRHLGGGLVFNIK
jgi:hypothetical protein